MRVRCFLIVVVVVNAASGGHALGILLVNEPTGNVHLMYAVVDDVAAGEVPEPVPVVVETVGIERTHGRGPQPHVVVHAFRHGRVRFGADGGALLTVEHAHEMHVAEFTGADVIEGMLAVFRTAILRTHLHNTVILAGRLNHLPAFPDTVRRRLFHVHVLARLTRENGAQRMPVVRRRVNDGVHIRACKHVPEITGEFRLTVRFLFQGRTAGVQTVAVRVREECNLHTFTLNEFTQQKRAPAPASHEPQPDTVIGSDHIKRYARRACRRSCHGCVLQKITSRKTTHGCFLQCIGCSEHRVSVSLFPKKTFSLSSVD